MSTLSGIVAGNYSGAQGVQGIQGNTGAGSQGVQGVSGTFGVISSSATTTVSSPLSWNSGTQSQYSLTALANALTINADSGTPSDGQRMTFRIEDNGTPRVITFTGGVSKGFRNFGTSLVVSGSNFTLTTVALKTYYIGCIYNNTDSRWDIVSLASDE